jgi:hypothetical protein
MAEASSLVRRGLGRGSAAALLLMLSLVVVVLPLLAFAQHLADQLVRGAQREAAYFAATPDQPTWIKGVPLFGRRLGAAWDRIVEVKGTCARCWSPIPQNLEKLMIGAARGLADSLVQVLLSLIVVIMFWTNGDGLVSVLHDALRRACGPVAEHALDVAAGAVCGVAYGVIGTARSRRPGCDRPGRRRSPRGLWSLAARDQPDRRTAAHLIWGGAAWWLFTQGPADEIRGFVSLLRQADAHRRCPEWVKVRPMFH